MSETHETESHEKLSETVEETNNVSYKNNDDDEHNVDVNEATAVGAVAINDTDTDADANAGDGGGVGDVTDTGDCSGVDNDAAADVAHVTAPVMVMATLTPTLTVASEPPPMAIVETTTILATPNEPQLSPQQPVAHHTAATEEEEEDLEDGEIDDDDDDDDAVAVVDVQQHNSDNAIAKTSSISTIPISAKLANVINVDAIIAPLSNKPPQQQQHVTIDLTTKVQTIDLSNDHSPPLPASATGLTKASSNKSKKGQPLDDDHMLNVEKALSNVLKKSGVEPQMPKFLETRQQDGKDNEQLAGQGQSRSSRRRKRKKQRDEKEKEKERKEKKKHRYESPDAHAPILLDDDDDVDDFEMLNVRGGSPSAVQQQSYMPLPPQYPYDSAEDSYTSYESADSMADTGGAGGVGTGVSGAGGDGGNRRRRRGKKDRKRRERRGRSRDDERGVARADKRNRRDSPDDKHRQEPRKLELCKFYLMECCAKKEKCSYMHSDFPCKYYYLGMDCVNKETCKFMHAEPLSEQLRNILLKHLETAPKEILGNFKRISRDTAISLMSKRNEELCKEYKVENTWSNLINLPPNNNRRGGNNAGSVNLNDNMHHQHQHQHQQQQQQLLQQQQQLQQQQSQHLTNQPHNNIPSLFDIVVKPPLPIGTAAVEVVAVKSEKHRKSRWNDYLNENGLAQDAATIEKNAPSHLDLNNLTSIMSMEHIEKLTKLGITNLEQVNQLTVGQLRQIGIDFAEISEIQTKALNMKEGGGKTDVETTTAPLKKLKTDYLANTKVNADPAANNSGSTEPERDLTMSSNSNSDSNGGVVRVDYSQYLKDSNLAFDRSDVYDDERDEEQLVIDDGNMEHEENARLPAAATTPTATTLNHDNDHVKDEPKLSSSGVGSPFNSLNPFRSFYNNTENNNKTKGFNPFKTAPEDKPLPTSASVENARYFFTRRQRERSRSRSRSRSHSPSRSRSRTPTRSQSTTPEASQSPNPEEPNAQPVYERDTMYDFSASQALEDERRLALKNMKTDKDMRFVQSNSSGGASGLGDLDLRLPFQAVTNYTPATEIDGSITSHLPMTYKLHVVYLPAASYAELRRNLASNTQTSDPRLRRILGLPETRTSVALPRSVRKLSNSIASPEPDESPKYYTPPSASNRAGDEHRERERERRHSSSSSSAAAAAAKKPSMTTVQPRLDPRRAAAAAAAAAASSAAASSAQSTTTSSSSHAANTNASSASAAATSSGKLRTIMQNSVWYRNLNSTVKIMVNQQLAHLTTELKKFHQDASPNKTFDFNIIFKNETLLEILKSLGVFINDNGEVEDVDKDNEMSHEMLTHGDMAGKALPDLTLPPPVVHQLDFLRRPPPPMAAANAPPAGIAVMNNRPSLLGLPQFNPFAANLNETVLNAFLGPGLMGPGPRVNFGNFPGLQHGSRNFNMDNNNRNHRNPTNRRNFL